MKVAALTKPLASVFLLALSVSACRDAAASGPLITVYATPSCGCCKGWMEHMRENGYTVKEVYQDDLTEIRQAHKLPREMTSCHMGIVDGFAIEGHVPASVVNRLLAEKPPVLGVSAPGMPAGSPGMEMEDGSKPPYEVFTWDASGPLAVYELIN
jgi:hypothetical protein